MGPESFAPRGFKYGGLETFRPKTPAENWPPSRMPVWQASKVTFMIDTRDPTFGRVL